MASVNRLLIFDLDGTLVDSLGDLTASVNAMRGTFALPPLLPAAVKELVGQGARNLVERALPGYNSDDVDAGLALFLAHNEAHLCDLTRLYPGVAETLAALAADGQTLALLSNKHEGLCRKLLEHFALDRLFSAVVGGDSLPWRKPSPEPIRHILKLLAQQPEQTFMVGDSINDVAAGCAAGVITVGCSYGYGKPAELAAAAFCIDNFSGLLRLPLNNACVEQMRS